MIKSVLVLCIFGACLAGPPRPAKISAVEEALTVSRPPPLPVPANSPAEVVPIVSQNSDVKPDGGYTFGFESGDGTVQEQKGVVKTVDEVPVIGVEGKYTYTDKDGDTHSITYTADENGYRAEGDTLPVAPPIPKAIARALKYIEEHPYVEEKTV